MKLSEISLGSEYWNRGVYNNANDAYNALFAGLFLEGEESAPRGLKIKEVRDVSIKILRPWDNIIYSRNRMLPPRYLAGEYFWYKSGSNKVDDIAKFSKFWLNIQNPNGTVNSNYGYYAFNKEYWKKHQKIYEILTEDSEQEGQSVKMRDYSCWWDYIKALLKADPDSRQAVIMIPTGYTESTKDTCCTPFVQFFIRNNKLEMHTCMRSNDIVKGFANDVFQFTMWQGRMADELGLEMGPYNHYASSLHLYETDYPDPENEYEFNQYKEYYEIDKNILNSVGFIEDLQNIVDKEYDKVKDERLKLLIGFQEEKRKKKLEEQNKEVNKEN